MDWSRHGVRGGRPSTADGPRRPARGTEPTARSRAGREPGSGRRPAVRRGPWFRLRLGLGLTAALGVTGSLVSFVPGELHAQETRVIRVTRPQAWIGFSFELRESWSVGAERTGPVMVVTDVHPDSPARRAGLQVGDTILRIDRVPVTPSSLARFQAALAPAQQVRFSLRRRGRALDVDLRAQARPADELLVSFSPNVRVRMDSAHAVFLAHLDSARVSPGPTTFRYEVTGDSERTLVWEALADAAAFADGWAPADPAFAPPFPTLLVPDARSEALMTRLRELDREMREVRLREARRLEELARQGGLSGRNDDVLREQARRKAEITREAAEVKARMERVAESTLADHAARVAPVTSRPARVVPTGPPTGEPRRALTPYITGQDRVAGARLTPLNGELGSYFGVASGLLVVEVGPGTPAADAQLLPGDVVVRVGGRPTATLEEIRRELAGSSREPAARLTVVRKGRTIELVLLR